MTRVSRKLLLSVMAVILTVIALGTTTFAWFTITNVANLNQFQTRIASDEGIEIALGNVNVNFTDIELNKYNVRNITDLSWVTTITTEDVEEYIELTYGADYRFEHLTSTNGTSFNPFISGSVGASPTTDGLLQLPLHFRSADVTSVLWTDASLSGVETTEPLPQWISDVDSFTDVDGVVKPLGTNITVDPSNAMRVSVTGFLTSAVATLVYEKPVDANNLVLNTGNLATTELDPDGVADNGDEIAYSDLGAHSYYLEKTGLEPIGIDAATTVGTTTDLGTGIEVLTLVDDARVSGMTYYNILLVNIWIEGWDPNAYNAILDKFVFLSFRFEGPSQD